MKVKLKNIKIVILFAVISNIANAQTANVSTEAQLLDAIANPSIHTINITRDINLSSATPAGGIEIRRRNLTINGPSPTNKATINVKDANFGKSEHYSVCFAMFRVSSCSLTMNNLIIADMPGINSCDDFVLANSSTFIANNCVFANNYGTVVYLLGSTFIANNCTFTNNRAVGANCIISVSSFSTFIANNCTFTDNISPRGGVIVKNNSSFVASNCTFTNNRSDYHSGAVHLERNCAAYFYHCTIDKNHINTSVPNFLGGGIYVGDNNTLYIYNCIITGNTVNRRGEGTVLALDQIAGDGTIISGSNLIEGENGITRDLVFGSNELTPEGYIMPLSYAVSAQRLTANDIEAPDEIITKSEILQKLVRDQVEKARPNNRVTYGSVETAPGPVILLTLQLKTSPSVIGKATGGGIYEYNDKVTITATTTDDSYNFIYWEDKDGKVVSTQSTYTFNITSNLTLTAVFLLKEVSLQLKTSPEEIGEVTGARKYEYNDSITITATTTDDCYYFRHWEDAAGNVISTDSEYTFPITSDSVLIAVFEQYSYFVFINAMPTFMGSIEGGTDGYYPCGRVFNLEAIPQDTIYKFVYWSSSDSTDTLGIEDTLTLIAKSPDTMIIAHFDNAVGIEENDIYDISIVPNPAKNDFSIIFENPDAQTISIELLDISGRTILDIFSGFAETGTQIYKVDSQLSSGTYLIKFVINNKSVIRKVIVR